MRFTVIFFAFIISLNTITAQDYFLENNGPYDNTILTPEQYLGYEIGFEHTRHDLIVAYLKYLSNISEKAQIIKYGESQDCLLYTSPSPRDAHESRMPSSA